MKKNANKETNLANLNVWASCKIQQINEDTFKWETIAECAYTPNAIRKELKKHGLEFAWINVLGNREMVYA